jgi:hypothetical protein
MKVMTGAMRRQKITFEREIIELENQLTGKQPINEKF